jgi:hypothetical protein
MAMNDYIRNTITQIVYKNDLDINLSDAEIDLLNSLPVDEVAPILVTIFKQESDLDTKSRAYHGILALEHFDRVQFLLDMLESSSVDWYFAYCKDLAFFHDRRAMAKLCNILLEDPEPDLRYVAAESLAEMGDTTAIAALEYAQHNDTGCDFEGFPIAEMAGQAIQKIRERLNKKTDGTLNKRHPTVTFRVSGPYYDQNGNLIDDGAASTSETP